LRGGFHNNLFSDKSHPCKTNIRRAAIFQAHVSIAFFFLKMSFVCFLVCISSESRSFVCLFSYFCLMCLSLHRARKYDRPLRMDIEKNCSLPKAN
jgi:hypothetical protein